MTTTPFPSNPILVVDDEHQSLESIQIALQFEGITNLHLCADSREVLHHLRHAPIEMMLLDLRMPHRSGEELLADIMTEFPDLIVIITTGVGDIETAVHCMRGGAFDYLVKPIEERRLISAVRRALSFVELRYENSMLKERLFAPRPQRPAAFAGIVTKNEHMEAIFQYAEAIAITSQPVLITGETGVGKELIANAIHALSQRPGRFVPVNVAGLDDSVFSDTLFGHLRGAFTGANESRKGLIEQAAEGTLFLDEIGDLNPAAQVKLLRLLQEREYLPLGSDVPKQTDARIIVATNRDLKALQEADKFRNDLYYRLRLHHVHIPPLRERLEDVDLLVEHFLSQAAESLQKRKPTPPPELFVLLRNYSWPGNVRELRSMVFDAVSKHKSRKLSMESFKAAIAQERPAADARPTAGPKEYASFTAWEALPTLKQAQELLMAEALRRTGNNQTLAAQLLGVTRQTLIRHLKKTASPSLAGE
ncbi:MAG: sigma-54-dependent Fis family transcriptional regulator [Kiritimatiellae bacterium]|nr:sigma-54-dependent Fis family transcriptional regulator [Kiritimatiellia bacterium]